MLLLRYSHVMRIRSGEELGVVHARCLWTDQRAHHTCFILYTLWNPYACCNLSIAIHFIWPCVLYMQNVCSRPESWLGPSALYIAITLIPVNCFKLNSIPGKTDDDFRVLSASPLFNKKSCFHCSCPSSTLCCPRCFPYLLVEQMINKFCPSRWCFCRHDCLRCLVKCPSVL
jgi:hypothetical protein